MSLYRCLANKAILNLHMLRKPIYPSFFNQHIIPITPMNPSLDIPFLPPNLAIKLSSLPQKYFGKTKHIIAYVGIVCNTNFMNISLPPCDRNLVLHPSIYILIWSLRFWNDVFFLLPTIFKSLKYFSKFTEYCIPNMLEILSLSLSRVFVLKKIVDLLKFIHWLEQHSFSFRTYFKIATPLSVASPKRMKSSTNNKWDICGPLLLALAPFINPSFIANLIKVDKPSLHMRKRKGLKGSPCRGLLVH